MQPTVPGANGRLGPLTLLSRRLSPELAAYTQRRWVAPPMPEAALRRLLRRNAATQYASVGSLASYGEDMVSLPTESKQPCYLADILPATWREVLESVEDAVQK